MDSSGALYQEALRYLERVEDLYPAGIPKPVVRLPGLGPKKPKLAFVALAPTQAELAARQRAVGAEGELLRAAAEKGLGLSSSEVYFSSVVKGEELAPAAPEISALWEELLAVQPKVTVFLGEEVKKVLLPAPLQESPRGSWCEVQELRILLTHTVEDVLASRERKKEFWEDLKSTLDEKDQSREE